ncbi:caspase family protein [Streptomyces sp. NPDC088360]|uniref:caspase, EACC1-associated type n=1 Tax=Streptomyces sp. NPDC088360 TaxID=3154515 RepID=UPI00344CD1A4
MEHLPQPDDSRAVFVGASAFSHLEDLPAVQANVPALRKLLCDAQGPFRTEHCTALIDPAAPVEMSRAMRQAAKEATDTLLIYYAGHGLLDDEGQLYLAIPPSESSSVYDTAVPYEWVRKAIASTRAARRIVILDCCYSARAFGVQSESVIDLTFVDGTYVMAAAGETAVALAPPSETYTAFTAELIATLGEGVTGAGEVLDLDVIFGDVRQRLRARGRPVPVNLDRNRLGGTSFLRNRAYVPAAAPAGGDAMLHVLELTPRTAPVAQLLSSVAVLSVERPATAGDLVRSTLQVRAVTELAQFMVGLFTAGHRVPVEAALPSLLLTRPVEDIAHLVDLLHAMMAEDCLVSVVQHAVRHLPADQLVSLAEALCRAGLIEPAQTVLSGAALTREPAQVGALVQTLGCGELSHLLQEVVGSVARSRKIADVTRLYLILHGLRLNETAELLMALAAQSRSAVDAAEMILACVREGLAYQAKSVFAASLARGPHYLTDLVVALQTSHLSEAAAMARGLAVETWSAEGISEFIAHLLAVGQHRHALAAAMDTARLRTMAEFGYITTYLSEVIAANDLDGLLDDAARSFTAAGVADLVGQLDAAGHGHAAHRVFWLVLLGPVSHAAQMLTHLEHAQSRFVSAAALSDLARVQHPSRFAQFALALDRALPDKTALLLDLADMPVDQVAVLVEHLEKAAPNNLSSRVLGTVSAAWTSRQVAQLVIALEQRSLSGCADYVAGQVSRRSDFAAALRSAHRPQQKQPWWPGKRYDYKLSPHTHVTIVAKRSETVQDLARRYGVRQAGIIDQNRIRAPYRLHAGQLVIIPLQSEGGPLMIPPLPRRLAPGRVNPGTRSLQKMLRRAGYLAAHIPDSDNYGPQTCDAVTRFNRDHMLGRPPAPSHDARITFQGWDILYRLARAARPI